MKIGNIVANGLIVVRIAVVQNGRVTATEDDTILEMLIVESE